jgi:endonuclease YncB( thermonuclease family)
MLRTITVSLALFLASAMVHAETLTGKVVKIADGDTITLLDRDNRQYRIRVAGIVAPVRMQPYYEAS